MAFTITDGVTKLVSVSCVELEPDKFSATPVKVPKAPLNKPKTPVWLMSVGCNELGGVKLKFTVAALALSAMAVPATKAASVFMAFSSSYRSAVWRRLMKHK